MSSYRTKTIQDQTMFCATWSWLSLSAKGPWVVIFSLKINLVPDNHVFESLPNDKSLDRSKFKAFADYKINGILQQLFFLGWVENIVGRGENLVISIFSFPHNVFKKPFSGSLIVGIML